MKVYTFINFFRSWALLLSLILLSSCSAESVTQSPDSNNFNLVGDVREDTSSEAQEDRFEILIEEQNFPVLSLSNFSDGTFLFSQLDDDSEQRDRIPASVPEIADLHGSDFSAITAFVDTTIKSSLSDFNKRLLGGEQISEKERSCFYGYEEALGEPLLALACESPLGLSGNSVQIYEGGFANTQPCVSSLINGNAAGCSVAVAYLSIIFFDAQSSGEVLESSLDEELQGSSGEDIFLVEIQFGGANGTLDLMFTEIDSADELVCSYVLATGDGLNLNHVEPCFSRSEKLVSIINDLAA